MTTLTVFSRSLIPGYRSANSLSTCTESTTAMGIKKIGIMELMMWTGNPRPIIRPMVAITVAIATIIGAMTSAKLLKKNHISRKTSRPARGAVMPIDAVPKSGKMSRFWLANPMVVMAGCVFCNPPTMADLIFVSTPKGAPLEVDRERLYRGVVYTKLPGRLRLGPHTSSDGVEYLFSLELKERRE